MIQDSLFIKWLGQQDYQACFEIMQRFTRDRTEETPDEVWLLYHNPVFTQGQNGKPEHVLNPGQIPIIQTDRGGQVTYHGPGQLMMYTLIDIKRKQLTIRDFVTALEEVVIELLAEYNIAANSKREAPGVYVNEKKICSIGLRVKQGRAYHGIAFNVDMDLSPFARINPCGFQQLEMTQFSALGGLSCLQETGNKLTNYLVKKLGYTSAQYR